ncbi:hypothetical protein JCM1393_04460 [Clostridium carnis]
MVRTYAYSADFDSETEKLFRDAKFLGEGHNGIVYELPGNKAVKIFQDFKCCREEGDILKKVNKSSYFPTVYSTGRYYIVREKIGGERLDHYIKKNGFNYDLSKNLYYLIKEFKKLKFTKIDARCRDIYVLDDGSVRVIDPKQCYKRKVNYPRHLMKGLKKIDVLDSFLEDIKDIDSKLGEDWQKKINQYYNEID